jgi:periplasmic protein CpxP/Spy
MKKLSLIIAVALGSLVACSLVSAQEAGKDAAKKGKRGFSAEQRLERMSTELKLTDEQKPKVKAVLEDSSKKMQGLRDLPQDERRTKMQDIRTEENKKFKEILTPDQLEKYKKMQEEMKKKGNGGKKKTE